MSIRRIFPFDSRRAIRIVEPAVELRLPIVLMIVTLLFAGLFAWNGHAAFQRLVQLALGHTPDAFRGTIVEQSSDFVIVSCVLLGAYLIAVVGVCLAFTHALLGPRVALLRQIRALKNGNYEARVALRRSDLVFREVGNDLNDLASILERADKDARRTRATRPLSAVI